MQAVTITQITPNELTEIIENCLRRVLFKSNELKDSNGLVKEIIDNSFEDWCRYNRDLMSSRLYNGLMGNFRDGKFKKLSMTKEEFLKGRNLGEKTFKEFAELRGYL